MQNQQLTSTTAPGKLFASRSELAQHYKSEWHKYNLKRREAGLAMLEEQDFQARWEAALALRKENQARAAGGSGKSGGNGKSHLKQGNKGKSKNKSKKQHKNREVSIAAATQAAGANKTGNATASATMKTAVDIDADADANANADGGESEGDDDAAMVTPEGQAHAQRMADSQQNPEIDPNQSLFDQHVSDSIQGNLKYMQHKYGFFLPDQEHLTDLEGLLGYSHEKIKLGHFCLYCEKVFPTWQGCQKHMIAKNHTKLRYEKGYWDELDIFYDFEDDDGNDGAKRQKATMAKSGMAPKHQKDGDVVMADGDNDDDGWEDMSDDGNNDDDDDEALYRGYEEEIARFGLDVTALGELVFPDGRIIGHRALKKYYDQRARPMVHQDSSVAIVAARRAAGERLYEGRVVNIHGPVNAISRGTESKGRGILVRNKDGVEGFSALSLYRYRAAVRKQRRGDEQGLRLKYRQSMNINKMDKKHNRLMNGVSVAHAAR